MLRAALNKSWRQMLTNEILYNGIPNISATIKEHRMRFTGHCWRSKNELVSDLLLLYPNHGKRSRGRLAKTYIDQLSSDTGYEREEQANAMQDRDGWRERVMKCRASSTCIGIYLL